MRCRPGRSPAVGPRGRYLRAGADLGSRQVPLDAAIDVVIRAALASGAGLDEGEGQVSIAWVEALSAAGRVDEARAAVAEALAGVEAVAAKVDDAEARETMRTAVPEHAALRAWTG